MIGDRLRMRSRPIRRAAAGGSQIQPEPTPEFFIQKDLIHAELRQDGVRERGTWLPSCQNVRIVARSGRARFLLERVFGALSVVA